MTQSQLQKQELQKQTEQTETLQKELEIISFITQKDVIEILKKINVWKLRKDNDAYRYMLSTLEWFNVYIEDVKILYINNVDNMDIVDKVYNIFETIKKDLSIIDNCMFKIIPIGASLLHQTSSLTFSLFYPIMIERKVNKERKLIDNLFRKTTKREPINAITCYIIKFGSNLIASVIKFEFKASDNDDDYEEDEEYEYEDDSDIMIQ